MTTASTSSSIPTEEADALAEIASALQQQLIYNGEVLDIALEGLRAYRPGTQSLAYLDAAVHLAYALLRMLEKWTKAGGADAKELVVRRRARAKARRKASSTEEGEGVVEDAEEEDRDADAELREAVFTFEAFEMVCARRRDRSYKWRRANHARSSEIRECGRDGDTCGVLGTIPRIWNCP